MRESMGGTWLFGIVALFIVLFSAFLAYSISYTKAFNTKNYIINLIEKYEGFTTSRLDVNTEYKTPSELSESQLSSSTAVDAQAYYYIKNHGYNSEDIECAEDEGVLQEGGYCIKRYCSSTSDYYKVTTYIKLKVPIINVMVKVPVTGETSPIYFVAGSEKGQNKKVDTNSLTCD